MPIRSLKCRIFLEEAQPNDGTKCTDKLGIELQARYCVRNLPKLVVVKAISFARLMNCDTPREKALKSKRLPLLT